MQKDIFKDDREEKTENPLPSVDPDQRHDKIILSLCLLVLALLIARIIFDFPRASKKHPDTTSVETPVRVKQKPQQWFKIKKQPAPVPTAGEKEHLPIQEKAPSGEKKQSVAQGGLQPEYDLKIAQVGSDESGQSVSIPDPPKPVVDEKLPKTGMVGEPTATRENTPRQNEVETVPASAAKDIPPKPAAVTQVPVTALTDAPTARKEKPRPADKAEPMPEITGKEPPADIGVEKALEDIRTGTTLRLVYSVQVGSFRTKAQAERHMKKMKGKGFDPAIVPLKDNAEKLWYVVQIGDYETKKEADAAASRFKSSSGDSPLIKLMPSGLIEERKTRDTSKMTAPAPKKEVVKIESPSVPNLIHWVRQGEYGKVAEAYEKQLYGKGHFYTIKLEVDCSDASIRQAFQQGAFSSQMFLLSINLEGKSCFLVMRGLYDTEKAARTAMTTLPSFFLDQAHPPQPVRLGDYLKSSQR